MKSLLLLLAVTVALAGAGFAQITTDVLAQHDLSPASGSNIRANGDLACTFCHAPHSGVGTANALWDQTLSTQTYTPYSSSTMQNQANSQPPLGKTSSLCLSCHDGTVAVGQTVAYGTIPMTGSMSSGDAFGSNLSSSHPFSLVTPMKDSPDLAASLVSTQTTADSTGAVQLVGGNVECTSCHNPHVQGIDKVAQRFLARDSSSGQLCLACHDPNRVLSGQANPLTGWFGSIHATAANATAAQANAGSYTTVAQNACGSCHVSHQPAGPVRLLRPATPASPGTDSVTQACMTCHNGSGNTVPAAPNIMAEFAKTAHPLPAGTNAHDAGEPAVLNNNRHATCVDCHGAHAVQQVVSFTAPPTIRVSQAGSVGVSASDGMTVINPAVNQYENCLRCHGLSTGKQTLATFGYLPARVVAGSDPLNVIPQFSISAISSHPVTHDSNSVLAQPSLRTYMLRLDGTVDPTNPRLVGTRIFCTDCHNSDDNREFGGTGPNGPHGSKWSHLLERQYVFSQVAAGAAPGTAITNLNPNPDLSAAGPYALCGKCHDLSVVVSSTSWLGHAEHVVNEGISCSACHTAHGMGGVSATISGQRLVNFDGKVVAPNGTTPITFSETPVPTCTLVCHGEAHTNFHF